MNAAYGGVTDFTVIAISRVIAGVILSLALLAFLSLNAKDAAFRRAVDATFTTAWGLNAILNGYNAIVYTPASLWFSWGSVAVFALISIGFGYELVGPDMKLDVRGARPMA